MRVKAPLTEPAQAAGAPLSPLSPWQALGYNPALLRAIEVALTGTHSLRIVGHPENGQAEWRTLSLELWSLGFRAYATAKGTENGERVRRELGLSQAKIGKLLGVSQVCISRWERGDRKPADETSWRVFYLLADLAQRAGRYDLLAEVLSSSSWHSPCACGYLGDPSHECTCSTRLIERYRRRLRATPYDIDVEAPRPRERDLANRRHTEPLSEVLARVEAARTILPGVETEPTDPAARQLLAAGNEKLALTLEARGRVVSVARTCAALAGRTVIRATDIAEALIYRRDWR